MFRRARPLRRSPDIEFRRYVFNRRKEEKDLSAVAVVTGNTARIFINLLTLGNTLFPPHTSSPSKMSLSFCTADSPILLRHILISVIKLSSLRQSRIDSYVWYRTRQST